MKLLFTVVCLLSAFVSKGYSLTCINCTSTSKSLCTGSSVTCSDINDVCTTIYTTTKIEVYGITTYSLVRGCGQLSECNQPKTLSNQFMTVDIITGCCNADNCGTTEPTVPINTVKNGLVCPSCFSLTSATCVADTEIQCTGVQTQCTTYSMSTDSVPSKPILGMAGCATQNLCANYNGTTSTSTTGKIRINITCSNAIVSPTTTTIKPSTSNPIKTSTLHLTSESSSTKPPLSTNPIHVTSESTETKSSSPVGTSDSHRTSETFSTELTARNTETNRQTSVVSGSHLTTDIANPTPTNSSSIHYTTRISFTPTAFHSSTHQIVATTTCVCDGCRTHYSIFAISLAVFVTLINNIYEKA